MERAPRICERGWLGAGLLAAWAGVVKQPFGISTEPFEVATVRNLGLPLSLYGPGGVGGERLRGLALAGRRYFTSSWAVARSQP
jgi:hypothetical protein